MRASHRTALLSGLAATALLASTPAHAFSFTAGDLVVSSSTYTGTKATVTVGQTLPGSGTKTAVADGTFPGVFTNATPDPSFGVTSPLFLNQFSIGGTTVSPTLTAAGIYNVTDATGVTTSFPSKSEGALNLSPDGHTLSFVDYFSAANRLDISNSNTPGIAEPGNYTVNATARAVVALDSNANANVIQTNAYPGNNGRAAIDVGNTYYLVGNAGNANGSPAVTAAGGVQVLNTGTDTQTAGAYNTTKAGSFTIAQTNPSTGSAYGTPTQVTADKAAKDDNYRGETIFGNTLYVTKGSGSNGINSVYQVGTAGSLPSGNGSATLNVLPGMPATIARAVTVATAGQTGSLGVTVGAGKVDAGYLPFGIWFANATTLYVADEGDGTAANAARDIEAGLQKWTLVNGKWTYNYTLQSGLNLGTVYDVCPAGSTTCNLTALAAPTTTDYTAATDGLRNITGVVNADGTVTIYAITSTVSLGGDQGADPNELVAITDSIANTNSAVATTETFTVLDQAVYGQVLRGVSFAPVPEPASMTVFGVGTAVLGLIRRRRNAKR